MCWWAAKGHGRVEHRYYYQAPLQEQLGQLAEGWKGLVTIGQVVSITERDGKQCSEVRYYLSSLPPRRKPGSPPPPCHRPPQAAPLKAQPQEQATHRRVEQRLPRRSPTLQTT
ncbi:MAG: hypothetical protein AAF662_03875 [Pseudomonadota bacterium]